MKILVVGGGGREHSLVWKLAQSPKVDKIYCAPGNAGIAALAECPNVSGEDIPGLVALAREKAVDLVIVGPEAPLSLGLADRMAEAGIRVCGASAKAARIEGSKAFAKDLMKKYGIPTAAYEVFDDLQAARTYVEKVGGPLVVKADGLAAGKGVLLCDTTAEALAALDTIMAEKAFGEAGNRVVVEEFLKGEEASFLVFTDGRTIKPLPTSQDHKAIYDGDRGPNTGGMGAYSPAPVVTPELEAYIMEKIMRATVDAMNAEGCPYQGVLYAGLMINEHGVKVLEFNARFGDPECQPLVMRLKSDLVDILEAIVDQRLDQVEPEWDQRATLCLVLASGGYPGSYEKGRVISGLEQAAALEDVVVFHAGTARKNGNIVTNGGRVLGVTALGDGVADAINRAYRAASLISWDGMYHRTDIGQKALADRDRGFVMQEKGFTHHDPTAVPAVRGESGLQTRLNPLVGVVMGSDSDLDAMSGATEMLEKFGIPYEITVASAHRSPERAARYSATAKERGLKVIIAGAGWAAHLAGVLAAGTNLPVIGVPLDSSPLSGLDSLLSTVQMPPGIPVATVALGKGGAKNAAVLAAQIIALSNERLAAKLDQFKQEMADGVAEKAAKVEKRFNG